jgi:hypothetical protein
MRDFKVTITLVPATSKLRRFGTFTKYKSPGLIVIDRKASSYIPLFLLSKKIVPCAKFATLIHLPTYCNFFCST